MGRSFAWNSRLEKSHLSTDLFAKEKFQSCRKRCGKFVISSANIVSDRISQWDYFVGAISIRTRLSFIIIPKRSSVALSRRISFMVKLTKFGKAMDFHISCGCASAVLYDSKSSGGIIQFQFPLFLRRMRSTSLPFSIIHSSHKTRNKYVYFRAKIVTLSR